MSFVPMGDAFAQQPAGECLPVTEDAVLGGKLHLRQLRKGHRVGHDAVLLAAACPARARDRVLDLGAGVGGAGLAVATRVADVCVTLVEIDSQLAALAGENAARNGLDGRVSVVNLDILQKTRILAAQGVARESFDHALMNPPFNDTARHRPSPDPHRRLAHAAPRELLPDWVKAAARLLRPGGTLTVLGRADSLDLVLRAFSPGFGEATVLPIHGRTGKPAIRVLVRGRKASHAPLVLLPGFFLNDREGRPLPEAQAVLRDRAELPLAIN